VRRLFSIALATYAVLLLAAPVTAQGIGRVMGNVRDVDGNPIKGATITAENPDAAPAVLTTTSDAKGRFGMMGLRRGTWTFTVRAPGFETVSGRAPIQTLGANPPMTFTLPRTPDPASTALGGVDVAALQKKLNAALGLVNAQLYDDAIAAYEGIVRDAPALTSIHLQLGWLHAQKKDYARAAAAYERVISAAPESIEAARARALAAALRP
jgi:tetratricopeptide (TPR) repeat protein